MPATVHVDAIVNGRIFTLSEARNLLPDVMRITSRHREEMEHLWAGLNVTSNDANPARVLWTHHQLNERKKTWLAAMSETGVIPVRLWEVSFDSGDGFHFSWRLGETDVEYVHRFNPAYGRRPAGFFTRRYIGSAAWPGGDKSQ